MEYLYIPLARPVGIGTIPRDVQWEYVEAPDYVTLRPDLPRSSHRHGLIKTSRPLTADEREHFDMRLV